MYTSKVRPFSSAASLAKSGKQLPNKPVVLSKDRVEFITKMVISELMELATTVSDEPIEFVRSCIKTDFPKPYEGKDEVDKIAYQADAFVDIIYYIYDSASRHGIDLDPVFEEVATANLRKIFPDGTCHLRKEDGKMEKPEGHIEADVRKVILQQLEKE